MAGLRWPRRRAGVSVPRSGVFMFRILIPALKGHNKSAQGIALGKHP